MRYFVTTWRLLWYVPAQLARILLCLIVLIGWGFETASRMWKDSA